MQCRTREGNTREQLLAITRVSWVLYRVKSRVLTCAVASALFNDHGISTSNKFSCQDILSLSNNNYISEMSSTPYDIGFSENIFLQALSTRIQQCKVEGKEKEND